MPSPIISGSPGINAKPTDRRTSVTKAKRLVRRRGRGRGDMSDEEFEREALTDSSDSQPPFDSDSDSEAEGPSAKSPANGGVHPAMESDFVRSSAPSPVPKSVPNGHKPVIPPSTNWSDMVAADEASADNLPVVDFDDLGKLAADPIIATPSTSTLTPAQLKAAKQKAKRKAKKEKVKALSSVTTPTHGPSTSAVPPGDGNNPQPDDEISPVTESKSVSAPSQHPPAPPKPTPRQAYLERLTNDPSYVPRVGAFWGHDDRLMEKELRSMSPWWRGRGRGSRGRGGAYASAGRDSGFRGGGGFGPGRARGRGFGPLPHQHTGSDASPLPGSPVPSREPSMSRDDARTHSPSSHHGHWSEARGRGGARGRGRGGGVGAPAKGASRVRGSSATQPPDQGAKPTPAKSTPRPGKKTERAWTKPLDDSLIANVNPRRHSRQNSSVAPPSPVSSDVRIKLPGASSPTSVQIQLENASSKPQATTPASSERATELRSHTPSSAEKPKPAVVKLPIRQKVRVSGPVAAAASAAAKSVKSPLSAEVELPAQSHVTGLDARAAITEEKYSQLADEKDPFVVHVPPDEDRANIVRQTLRTSAVSSSPIPSQKLPVSSSPADPLSRPESAAPPPFAPAYVAPQTAFAHLPPGVGYSDNGMLFELATGRPVILAPPQPAPMFQPPPRMPYVPSLTHEFHHTSPAGTPSPLSHHFGGYPSADSPRYSPYPPETTPVDASAPIFVPARPSAVEIRAPSVDGESSGSKSSSGTSASSLSTSASTAGAKPPKQSVKTPSNLRTSLNAPTEPNVPDGVASATKGDSIAPQPPFAPQPYAPGQYYLPGPDYAVYAPVPVGVDGQPQYGAFYPEAQYGIPPYGDPYASYGTVYYGPGPYNQVPASNEAEVPRFY